MQKLKRWLYAIAIAIFSALLVAFAYDIEKGTSIDPPGTQIWYYEILMSVANTLGVTGSILVAAMATGIGLYYAIRKH